MINIKDKEDCCGCSGCSVICPYNCIKLQRDEEGFEYPVINLEKCINCGLCEIVCPVMHADENKMRVDITYAGYYDSDKIRGISSSGGVFYALASFVIGTGGGVVGAKFDENLIVRHECVFNKKDLIALCGSKYVQSQKGNIYHQVEGYLKEGKMILFSGTPCEIAGLKSFLKRDYEGLICIEIVCHGVPSPKVLEKNVSFQENEFGKKLTTMYFRDKSNGWKKYSIRYIFCDGNESIIPMKRDAYMKAFLWNLDLRPSCYSCRFKKENMVGDILIGDFWGIDKVIPALNDDKGISVIVVESEKGNRLIKKIKDKLILEEVDFEEAIKENTAIISSVHQPYQRKNFIKKMPKNNWDIYVEKKDPNRLKNRVINKVLRMYDCFNGYKKS